MYSTSDFRNGLKLLIDGVPFEITYFQHVKPGKGGAFVRTKLRNLKVGTTVERTFRAGEKFEVPDMEDVTMQFLYADDMFHFMNSASYEQIAVPREVVGDTALYLKENTDVRVLLFNGEVLSIELPTSVILKITRCDPGVRGDTVSNATKPATLETGATVQVPLFVNEGENIKVDTRTGTYLERA